jgi:hemoglobin-like flavoprotein
MSRRSGAAGQRSIPFSSTKTAMATLGISTNTRLVGLAIINKDRLVDYSIHLYKSSWSPAKAEKIVTSLEPCVRQYCIKKVALSIPFEHHQTKQIRYLIGRIQEFFLQQSIPVFTESPASFHSLWQTKQKRLKKMLMKSMVERFPELRYCYVKELRNKNKYYVKLFEAVGVAAMQEQNA